MQDYIAAFFLVLFIGFLGYLCLGILIDRILEPAFALVTHRPLYLHFYPFRRRLPAALRRHIDLPFYRRLSDKGKGYFEHRLALFLSRYEFHGREGLVVTDGMKVAIASSHIMLTFGMRNYLTPAFNKIILYPDQYYSSVNDDYHKGEFNPRMKAIVFSWKHFEEGCRSTSDNLHLGIHEFAHAMHYAGHRWSREVSASIFVDTYDEILEGLRRPGAIERLQETGYFREYAYANPFEFIAVILEHFFETPHDFQRHFPELYGQVSRMINYRER